MMIFVMASALAPNFAAQLVFRTIAGAFAATPLTCSGGSISDLWNPLERVAIFPIYALSALMGKYAGYFEPQWKMANSEIYIGPLFGPIAGGFIGESSLVSWRWTEWVTLIISGMVLALIILFQPETYAPILLQWKAHHLRHLTGNDRYQAEIEIRQDTFLHRLTHALYRPFILTFAEPIVMLIALYLTIVYIILFAFLNGYTFIFTDTYGFSQGVTGLSFVGIFIGYCFTCLLVPLIYIWAKRDLAKIKQGGGHRLPPE